ncbi:hypothetical protein J3R83DRAFT_10691 [Lanmaoa asiatica]|nr:hypothetical protein J3R83DRAFT_10691 [Lanmaoa asiatica]
MSANLLRQPGKMHTFTDDLESFLHVLGWTTLRYLPAVDSYEAEDRNDDMTVFDEYSVRRGSLDRGGLRKSDTLGAGTYPSRRFHPNKITPLRGLLRTLSSPFKSLYASDPPHDALREKYERLKQRHPHDELAYSDHIVPHIRPGHATLGVFRVVYYYHREHVNARGLAYRRRGCSKSPDWFLLYNGRSGRSEDYPVTEHVQPVGTVERLAKELEARGESDTRT